LLVHLLQHREIKILVVAIRDVKGNSMKSFLYRMTLVTAAMIAPVLAHAQISIAVNIEPPALPVYVQPPIPGDGYMWTPGYWSWDGDANDYYWVPGTWVSAPYVGALWTPGYWGWNNGAYAWNGGYWGTHIGYYGGINYGFGYVGVGYQGGNWNNGAFNYNRSVNNISNVNITHVYNTTVVNNMAVSRVSFNGGTGGVQLKPTAAEISVAHMPHTGPTAQQMQHEQTARATPDLRASVNHGAPKIAATPEPGKFNAPNIVAAKPASEQAVRPAQQQVARPAPQQAARPAPQQAAERPATNNYAQRPQVAPQQHVEPRQQPAPQAAPRPQPQERPAPQEMHEQPREQAQQPHEQAPHAAPPPRQNEPRPAEKEEEHK
jgi:hypothetical protein